MKKEYRVDSLVNEYAQKYPDLLSESLATNEGLERALASVSKLREAHQAAFKHFDSEVLERTFESVSRMRATHQAMFGGSAMQRVIDDFTELREMQQAAVGAFPKSDTLLQAMESMLDGGVNSQFRALEKISQDLMNRAQVSGVQSLILDIERRLGEINLPAIDAAEVELVAEELKKEKLQKPSTRGFRDLRQDFNYEYDYRYYSSKKRLSWIEALRFLFELIGAIYCVLEMYDRFNINNQEQPSYLEQENSKKIEEIKQLLEELVFINVVELDTHFHVRERVANVRSKPKHGSTIESVLMPNDRIKLIRKKSKWVEVEYHDKATQETYSGWVLKKYLERVST